MSTPDTTAAAPADHRQEHGQAVTRPVGNCRAATHTPGFCPFVNRIQKAECHQRRQADRRPLRREIR